MKSLPFLLSVRVKDDENSHRMVNSAREVDVKRLYSAQIFMRLNNRLIISKPANELFYNLVLYVIAFKIQNFIRGEFQTISTNDVNRIE